MSAKKRNPSTSRDPALDGLARLVGTWTTEATHPAMPGVVVHGTVVGEWLEGERFLAWRSTTDHPDFPDSLWIVGFTDRDRDDKTPGPAPVTESTLTLHHYDSRGVFRIFDVSIDATTVRLERIAPGFSQRFTGTFADDGDTIVGLWMLCEDDVHWKDDLQIAYWRGPGPDDATGAAGLP